MGGLSRHATNEELPVPALKGDAEALQQAFEEVWRRVERPLSLEAGERGKGLACFFAPTSQDFDCEGDEGDPSIVAGGRVGSSFPVFRLTKLLAGVGCRARDVGSL